MSNVTDLTFISNQIALSATKLHKKIDETGIAVDLPAKSLLAKIPTAKVFEGDIALFRVGKFEEKYFGQTLALYLSDDGIPTVYSPDLKPVDKFEIVRYVAGINGTATIKKGADEFIINFPMSAYQKDNLADMATVSGEGIPPSELCKNVPHRMAYWEKLDPKETYSIVSKTSPDTERYNTERWMIADSKGNKFEVYENASLRKIVSIDGDKASFKIGKIEAMKDGNKKVELISTSSDFSDITV